MFFISPVSFTDCLSNLRHYSSGILFFFFLFSCFLFFLFPYLITCPIFAIIHQVFFFFFVFLFLSLITCPIFAIIYQVFFFFFLCFLFFIFLFPSLITCPISTIIYHLLFLPIFTLSLSSLYHLFCPLLTVLLFFFTFLQFSPVLFSQSYLSTFHN